uniref:class I SAM-dependent methyltransferase n=1 Tax=Cupriavidus ulmosensis TaxID=3065913 RepID=UPI003F856622
MLATRFLYLRGIERSKTVGKVHYDLGNGFYVAMLGRSVTYTSGYWKDARSLDEAQEAKLDLVCRKFRMSMAALVGAFSSAGAGFSGCMSRSFRARGAG